MADDIKVRLSPDGVAQVRSAFRQVQQDSQRSSRAAARGINSISNSLGSLRRQVIGVVGAYASFRGVQSLVGGIVRATIEQEKAIAAVESRIKSTGGVAGVTSEELVKMAANLQAATTFGDEDILNAQAQLLTFTKVTRENFGAATEAVLNLSTVMGTDLRSSVVQIGKALNDPIAGLTSLTRSGIQFTASQREMIRSLVETGRTSEAQRVILRELETQFGGAARAARDTLGGAFAALKNAAGDLMEADGASLPGITGAINDLTDTLNDPAVREGFQSLITSILTLIRLAAEFATEFASLGQQIGFFAANVGGSTTELDVLEQRLREVNRALSSSIMGRPMRFITTSREELEALQEQLEGMIEIARNGGRGIIERPGGPAPGSDDLVIDARVDLRALQADLQAAGTILADESRRMQDRLRADLERGAISLEEFYRRRVEIETRVINQTLEQRRNALKLLDEEIRLLEERGESIEQQEGRRKQLIAEVTVLQRQRADVELRATEELARAQEDLARQRFQFEQRLLELQGREREARLRALDEEIAGYRKLMQAQQMAADEIERRLGEFRSLAVARLDFGDVIAESRRAIDELDRIRDRVRQDAEAGLITQFQAEKQILELERQRVGALQEIAARAEQIAIALGDPEALAQVQRLNDEIRQLGAAVDTVTQDMARLDEGAQDAFRGSLQDVLSGLGREITSVSDAVTAFAQNFVQQIQNIAAEIISRRATFALLNALGGSFFNFGASGPGGFASGGLVRGPGTGTSDSIPAYLSDREYVVRSKVVEQPGMLEFLEHLNSGGLRRMPRFSGSIPRFAAGGLVDASQLGGRDRPAAAGGITVQVFANTPERFRGAEARVAASTANAAQIAANRNS